MRCRHLICFNSIKVRLNRLTCGRVEGLDTLFQFHKGTIKPGKHYDDQTLAHLFQFHKGTIKPRRKELEDDTSGLFQFHKGTIKPFNSFNASCFCASFNSIKVRLNQESREVFINNVLFQFHKGTIKPDLFRLHYRPYARFNSIKVRLNRHQLRYTHPAFLVSIP